MERASKLGHMKVIEHEHVSRLLRQFERTDLTDHDPIGYRTGAVDLSAPSPVEFIITVDGGEAVIPNEVRRDKRMAFIKFCAMLIRRDSIAELRKHPIVDPRDIAKMFDEGVWYQAAALPLAGIRIPGETVKDTIRKTVDAVLEYTKLYDVLSYLVFRKWDPSFSFDPARNPEAPHMECVKCRTMIFVPKDAFHFTCPSCGHGHRLSDYLGIAQNLPNDWAREEAVVNLRNALETLTLFHFVIRYWQKDPEFLSRILFIKDGPLLLRAQLGRLVEPIRSLLSLLKTREVKLQLVGIEKNGELVDHVEEIKTHLPEPGDFFLPSIRYIFEEVAGLSFDHTSYRNRVQYGSKAVIRLGPDHVVVLDVPTGPFLLEPKLGDLMGLRRAAPVLAEMTSYSHDNALIPIKLVNDYSSISQSPSGDILKAFAGTFFE
jgi:hypothetical protein